MLGKKLRIGLLGTALVALVATAHSIITQDTSPPYHGPTFVTFPRGPGSILPKFTIEQVIANKPGEVSLEQCQKFFSPDFFDNMAKVARSESFTYNSLIFNEKIPATKRVGRLLLRLVEFSVKFPNHDEAKLGYVFFPVLNNGNKIASRPIILSTYYCDIALRADQGE